MLRNPTPVDDALKIASNVAASAGAYSTPWCDLGSGFTPGGLGVPVALVVAFADAQTGGSATVEQSLDGTAADPAAAKVTIASLSPAGKLLAVPFIARDRYLRLSLAGIGATAAIKSVHVSFMQHH